MAEEKVVEFKLDEKWHSLDCARPWYHEHTSLPEGHIRTVIHSNGEWWWAEGAHNPPLECVSWHRVCRERGELGGDWETLSQLPS